jgi:electron transport complex protein RnfB
MIAMAALTMLGLTLGGLLGLAARYLKVEGGDIEEEIVALLPGNQCGQCGYPGCSAAAAAMVVGTMAPTACPAVGPDLAETLAAKLGMTVDLTGMAEPIPQIAFVHEGLCIGCTKCQKRCQTDAIVGGPHMIHTVFSDACTGCKRCFEVCPTECIEMRTLLPTLQTWYWPKPALAKA